MHSSALNWLYPFSIAVPESRFDHDSEESGEEMEDEEEEEDDAGDNDPTPQSQTHSRSPTPEENYVPESPPISPVELKKELPKYLPALQVGVRVTQIFIHISQKLRIHHLKEVNGVLLLFRVVAVWRSSSAWTE